MKSPAERLRHAREKAGYDVASDAARAMGIPLPTYLCHENGHGGLTRAAPRYADFFRVSLDWLLRGRGEMRGRRRTIPIVGYVGAGATVLPTDDGGADVEDIELPYMSELQALRISGDSQWPRFLAGEIVVFSSENKHPGDLIGRYCICDLEDGRRLLKILRQGAAEGTWRLESHNAPPEDNIRLRAAYPFIFLVAG